MTRPHPEGSDDPFAALSVAYEEHLGTLRGRVRQTLVEARSIEAMPSPPARILDVGGGAGHEAARWCALGYEVLLADPSEEMLERARVRFERVDAKVRERVRFLHVPTQRLHETLDGERFPVVVCHGVLMYEEDPEPVIAALVEAAEPEGLISILAKNRDAISMRPALQGRWSEAAALLGADRSTGGLGRVTRADSIADLTESIDRLGASVLAWFGVRVFTDHLGDMPVDREVVDEIVALELAAGAHDPYRQVARLIHVLARRDPGRSA